MGIGEEEKLEVPTVWLYMYRRLAARDDVEMWSERRYLEPEKRWGDCG